MRSYPNEDPIDEKSQPNSRQYRYSIVFVLRAHFPVPINTDTLTTPIIGEFANPLRDITALDMFKTIHAAHYNINTEKEEREAQKRKLDEAKKLEMAQEASQSS